MAVDRHHRVLPHPIRPASLDDLEGIEREVPNAEEFALIRDTPYALYLGLPERVDLSMLRRRSIMVH